MAQKGYDHARANGDILLGYFQEWLGSDPLVASAGLDRLTHKAHLVVITDASFRAHGPRSPRKDVLTESTSLPQ